MFSQKQRILKLASTVVALLMTVELVAPIAAFALTGGPVQPDFTNFEPVASSGMVNNFTGDFTYSLPVLNVPGAHGGGYAMSLSYNSGVQPEEEASWVGYGWTLNPGAILRGTRGYPDDYYGAETTNPTTGSNPPDHVVEYNRVKPNWTLEAGWSLSPELISHDLSGKKNTLWEYGELSNLATLNSYRGFGFKFGLTLNTPLGSLNYRRVNDNNTFNFDIGSNNWRLLVVEEIINSIRGDNEQGFMSRLGQKLVGVRSSKLRSPISRIGTYYYSHTMAGNSFPTNTNGFDSDARNFNFSVGGSIQIKPWYGIQTRMLANYSRYSQDDAIETNTWGYIYNSIGQDNSEDALDYYVEKESMFNLRDKYLALPFANPDQFYVSGEGLGGGFRAFNSGVGIYRPKKSFSETDITQIGAELGIGGGVAVGLDLGVGFEKQRSGNWAGFETQNSAYRFASEESLEICNRNPEPLFFRFNNDLGGRVEFAADDHPVKMSHPPDITNGFAIVPNELWPVMNQGERSKRSSNIRSANNEDVLAYKGLTRTTELLELNHNGFKIRESSPKGLGEFAITTPQGATYLYGLPVYSAEETQLTFLDEYVANDADLHYDSDNYLGTLEYDANSNNQPANERIKSVLDQERTRVVGQYKPRPYASSMLLTEVRSADYVDVGADGPDEKDLGGWVKFDYDIVHGDSEHSLVDKDTPTPLPNSSWYRYRMPYTGLQYDPGSIADPSDDRARMQSGYRQTYYLETIETNTHIAKFYTSQRRDGVSASENERALLENSTSTNDAYIGSKYQRKLDKIELYAKGIDGTVDFNNDTPLRTVHFEYDYTLMKGVPNADNMGVSNTNANVSVTQNKGSDANVGRLTLKNVWFEYRGVKSAKLSAYTFNYQYPDAGDLDGTGALQTKYPGVLDFAANLSEAEQNPNFDARNTDKWGNYSYGEAERVREFKPGINQIPDPTAFDPAAWHLKEIITPAGGSIIVQYEQDDYKYVHEKNAMVLCPIYDPQLPQSYGVDDAGADEARDFYYLDTQGSLDANTDLNQIRSLIQDKYVNGDELLYFKFLFSINPDKLNLPDLSNREFECEYLDGYVKVESTWVDTQTGAQRIGIKVAEPPKKTCLDWYHSNSVQSREAYEARENYMSDDVADNASAVLSLFGRSLGLAGVEFRTDACSRFHPELSYLRIPVDKRKLGGGVRVKRLLMYDGGLDASGGESLYGNEYLYLAEDNETSSGVATNEPLAMREENPLIRPLVKREEQSDLERLAVGKDKDEFEGPMGESLLPSPLVCYSRVVVKNIYDKQNGNGFAIHEYNTYRDYPLEIQKDATTQTDASQEGDEQPNPTFENTDHPIDHEYLHIPYPGGSVDMSEHIMALQSYSFVLNAMNGRPKRTASYGGDYSDPDTYNENASQSYEYFAPGKSVPMFYGLDKAFRFEQPGKEMEVAIEARHFYIDTDRGNVEVDVGFLGFFPVSFTSFPTINASRVDLHQAVTTKVVRYPVLVKSVTSVQDGISHTTENVAFDPATGQAVLTKTSDGYDGLSLGPTSTSLHKGTYHHYNLKAWTQYHDMAQKSLTEGAVIPSSALGGDANVSMSVQTSGSDTYLLIEPDSFNGHVVRFYNYVKDKMIRPGDIIEAEGVVSSQAASNVYYVGGKRNEVAGSSVEYYLYPVENTAIEIATLPANLAKVRIVRSGRDNSLGASVGSIVTYGEDKEDALSWAKELQRREHISNYLNEHLYDCVRVGLHSWNMPKGKVLKIEPDRFGNTENWESEHGLRFKIDAAQSKITVTGHRIACGTDVDNNPAVEILNDYLDHFWSTSANLGVFPTQPTCNDGVWDYASYFSGPATTATAAVEATLDNEVGELIRKRFLELSATSEYCLFDETSGSQQLEQLKFKLRTSHGPNITGPNETSVAMRRAGLTTASRRAVLNLVYGAEETPLLRGFVEITTATIYQDCRLRWGLIPGTDRGLAAQDLTRDDFTYVNNSVLTWDHIYNSSGATTSQFTDVIGRFYQDNNGQLIYLNLKDGDVKYEFPMSFIREVFDDNAVNTTDGGYTEELEMSKTGPGKFSISDAGQIVYVASDDDEEQTIQTLVFKDDGYPYAHTLAGPTNYNNLVIAANAMTYSDDWDYTLSDYVAAPTNPGNDYYWNKRGRFRPVNSYAVRQNTVLTAPTDISGYVAAAHDVGARSWEMGMMETFTPFDFDNLVVNKAGGWFKVGGIGHYSPHGEVRESHDILKIPSSVEFAYGGLLPSAVAGNATTATFHFESFEEENASLSAYTDEVAHAGKQAMVIGSTDYTYDDLVYNQHWNSDGGIVRFWGRNPVNLQPLTAAPRVSIEENNGSGQQTYIADLVTRMGEWSLYEVKIPDAALSSSGLMRTVTVRIATAGGETMHLDDVRIQPYHSGMVAYVYDVDDLRLLATFDEQNFGLFYQYNAEGKLLRSVVESLAGRKTVVENYAHVPRTKDRSQILGLHATSLQEDFDTRAFGAARPDIGDVNGPGGNSSMLDDITSSASDAGSGKFQFGRKVTLPDSLMDGIRKIQEAENDK